MADFQPFHSAVNRIPVLRQSAHRLADQKVLSHDLFRDKPAPSHGHLAPDLWSGSIDLELTVRTPLVFGEQTKERGKTHVDLPTDGHGNLVMPPTMVKGMISRAYETLTCSRFRVFGDVANEGGFRRSADDRSVPLTYRGDPASALRLVPIRVSREDGDGLVGELFYGDTQVQDGYRKGNRVYPIMPAAALQSGSKGHARRIIDDKTLEKMTPHGRRIDCHLTLCLHGDKRKGAKYAYWQVTHIHNGSGFVEVVKIHDSVTTVDHMKDVSGYVCRTAPPGVAPGRLFTRKHDERFVFDVSPGGATEVRIDPDVREGYRAVVESYMLHRENESPRQRHTPNRATYTAQQAGDDPHEAERAASLAVGDVAFAVVEETDSGPLVREIVPTMIGRHAYQRSPMELARAQQVEPVSSAEKASAADRLFGYVVPGATENAKGADVATRGRIIFGPVDSSQARISTKPKQLAPLLTPKPSSARRFLTDSSGATPKRKGSGALRREGYFTAGQQLGAATYPVHRRLLEGKDLDRDGFPEPATKAAVLDGREQVNDAVRLNVRSWVKPGSVLRCTMSFTNLSKDELGALVWVLTPENLVPTENGEKAGSGSVGYLRMGLGKPFGLGVIEVRIAPNGLRARKGADLAAGYAELTQCLGESGPVVSPKDFPLPNEDALLKTPWVQAMQRSAYGYPGDVEVRHMSLDENKKNNQTDRSRGEPLPGTGISPRDMWGNTSGEPIQVVSQTSSTQ